MSSNNTDDRDSDVGAEVERLIKDAMISLRGAGVVLGVSHSSLFRWIEGTNRPYRWLADSVLRRIELLREEDTETGLFKRLTAMSHRERVDALVRVIAERTEQVEHA